jgi:predicted nucleic acid-binding protein
MAFPWASFGQSRGGASCLLPTWSLLSPPLHESIARDSGAISTSRSTRILLRVPEPPSERGLLDTSVVIGLGEIDAASLPGEVAVSALTMAELAAGPHATSDPEERGRRQERLQRAEAVFAPLPFDASAARAYGRICASIMAMERKARGRRVVDLLIAATAIAEGLPLYTRNPDDFRGLAKLLDVRTIDAR